MKKNEVKLLQKVCENEDRIEKKKREISLLENDIKVLQDECNHSVKVCLDKQIITMGYFRHESEYVECLICGRELNLINDKADIDLSNEFSEIESNKKRIILRRQLARNLYLNSMVVKNEENDSKVLVKK